MYKIKSIWINNQKKNKKNQNKKRSKIKYYVYTCIITKERKRRQKQTRIQWDEWEGWWVGLKKRMVVIVVLNKWKYDECVLCVEQNKTKTKLKIYYV